MRKIQFFCYPSKNSRMQGSKSTQDMISAEPWFINKKLKQIKLGSISLRPKAFEDVYLPPSSGAKWNGGAHPQH